MSVISYLMYYSPVLLVIIFLIVLWKFLSWGKTVKILLTILLLFFSPYIILWGAKGIEIVYVHFYNVLNPIVVNQSQTYSCSSTDSGWGKCVNIKYKFSFDYPEGWNYIDLRPWKPEGIGFGTSAENLSKDYLISFFRMSRNFKSEDEAKSFAKKHFLEDVSGKDVSKVLQKNETKINGLYAIKNYKITPLVNYKEEFYSLKAVVVDKDVIYQFNGLFTGGKETLEVFDQMVDSFSKQ